MEEETYGKLIVKGIKGGIAIGGVMVFLLVCASYSCNSRNQNGATSEGNYKDPQKSVSYSEGFKKAYRFFFGPPQKRATHEVPYEKDPRYDGGRSFD